MILFVDFDGVLHPGTPTREDRCFTKVGLLADWLRRWPQVRVVVSSAWRKIHTLEDLQGFFPEDVRDRVVGVAPVLEWDPFANHSGPSYEREMEIQQWLRASPEPWAPWAALDDSPWLFRPFTKELVVVDRAVGITELHFVELERLLGLEADPFELLTSPQFGERLNVSEAKVRELKESGAIYAVRRGGESESRYPAFQAWPGVVGGPLRAALEALGPMAGSTTHGFFASPNEFLGGLTPVDALAGRCYGRQLVKPEGERLLLQSHAERLAAVVATAGPYKSDTSA